ncbi:MAG: DUF3000 domain-containing protein [Bowdeniella nasicola]|nr:DUF3000 domain-containing protein [Bowdeniella nasicola]
MSEFSAPSEFLTALESLRGHRLRKDITLNEIPGPTRLAPYAAALNAEVWSKDNDVLVAHGKFIVLYDPDGQPSWHGDFRVIVLVKAPMDNEVAADPLLGEVGWSWLMSALDDCGVGFHHASGTVTRVLSESFGGLQLMEHRVEMEIRGSWTPVTADLGPHLQAWLTVLEMTAGLPPELIATAGEDNR